jgi:hypothetical protein
MRCHRLVLIPLACAALLTFSGAAFAVQEPAPGPENAEELAKQLANPIADVMRLPMKLSYVDGLGASDDDSFYLDVLSVHPFSLGANWNLVTRTSIRYSFDQPALTPLSDGDSGFGDLKSSLYFTRKDPRRESLIWGVGPALQLPTATEDNLGADQWGFGPAAVGLLQRGQWTFGAQGNHVWGISHLGSEDHPDLNVTYFEPFASYVTRTAWTFTVNSDATYDWEGSDTSMPVNFLISKFARTAGTPIQVSFGVTYFLEESDGGPEGVGFSIVVTPVLVL